MESRVNYMVTGAFVVIFGAALLAFVFWMGKYGYEKESYDLYRIYLDESVSGLNEESPVKYKGVEIGTVSAIGISKKDPEKIEVELQVKKGTPIRENAIAQLGSQGITGLKYIEIGIDSEYKGPKPPPLIEANEEGYRIIRSGKSLLGQLGDSAETITRKAETLLKNLNELLVKENIDNFKKILANTREATSFIVKKKVEMDRMLKQAEKLFSNENVKNIKSMLANLDNASEKISTILKKHGDRIARDMEETSKEARRLVAKIRKSADAGSYDLKRIAEAPLEHLEEILEETKRMLRSTQEMVESLRESPSDIIFRSKEIKYGPGEI